MKFDKQTILSLGAIVLAGVFSYASIEAMNKKEESKKSEDYPVKSENKQSDIQFVDFTALRNTRHPWVEYKLQGEGVTITGNDAKSLKDIFDPMQEEKRAKITVKITFAGGESPDIASLLKRKYKINVQGGNTFVMSEDNFLLLCEDRGVLESLKAAGGVFQVKGRKKDAPFFLQPGSGFRAEAFGTHGPVGEIDTYLKVGDTVYLSDSYKEGAYDVSGKLKWEHRDGVLTLHKLDLIDKALATLKERNSTIYLILSDGDDVIQELDRMKISYRIRVNGGYLEADIVAGEAAGLIRKPKIRNHLMAVDIVDSGIEEGDLSKILLGEVSER